MKQTTAEKRAAMMARIRKHGENLLAIFPNATERDPVKLSKKLFSLESKAHRIAERLCEGVVTQDHHDKQADAILEKVDALLGNKVVPVFLNSDPRGYALKVNDSWMRAAFAVSRKAEGDAAMGYHAGISSLYRDMGGYGILAPDLSED